MTSSSINRPAPNTIEAPASNNKSVTIAKFRKSSVILIPKEETAPTHECWYIKQELNQFKRTLIEDAHRIRRDLEETPVPMTTPEDLYECLGLDSLVNRDVAMEIIRKRQAHTKRVLAVQSSKKEYNGVCDYVELATVSGTSSQWSRNRAHDLALAYSRL